MTCECGADCGDGWNLLCYTPAQPEEGSMDLTRWPLARSFPARTSYEADWASHATTLESGLRTKEDWIDGRR